ncbi:MAG: hypothetical protein COB78_02755 [Hyphomicrobiales bacterium]|nr:MAG: hypothetical protein COB78_02755 [Hyphomicrobiales bacterium]
MADQMKKTPLLLAGILLASVTTLTGCNQYLSRDEGITTFAGEALAANEAISVVDTWPDDFDDTNIPTDGKRQTAAIKRYRNPDLGASGGGQSSNTTK